MMLTLHLSSLCGLLLHCRADCTKFLMIRLLVVGALKISMIVIMARTGSSLSFPSAPTWIFRPLELFSLQGSFDGPVVTETHWPIKPWWNGLWNHRGVWLAYGGVLLEGDEKCRGGVNECKVNVRRRSQREGHIVALGGANWGEEAWNILNLSAAIKQMAIWWIWNRLQWILHSLQILNR